MTRDRIKPRRLALLLFLILPAHPGLAAEAPPSGPEPDLWLESSLDRTQVVVGQPVRLTVTLLAGEASVRNIEYPRLPRHPAVRLSAFSASQPASHARAGQEYTAHAFTATLLPLAPGALTLGPPELGLERLRPGQGPEAFFGAPEVRAVTLRGTALALEVRPLPATGRPADFSGALGRFAVRREVTPREVEVGDPVTVTTRITGSGPLDRIPCASLDLPGVRSYPPQRRASVGKLDCRQVLVPGVAGPLVVPGGRVNFYDIEAGQYREAKSAAISVQVKAARPANIAAKPTHAEAKTTPAAIKSDTLISRLPGYWLAGLIAVIATGVSLFVWMRNNRTKNIKPIALNNNAWNSSVAGAAKANTVPVKSPEDWLSEATSALLQQDTERFHTAAYRALQARLGNEYGVAAVAVTEGILRTPPAAIPYSPERLANYRRLFELCNRCRYSPDSAGDTMLLEEIRRRLTETLRAT